MHATFPHLPLRALLGLSLTLCAWSALAQTATDAKAAGAPAATLVKAPIEQQEQTIVVEDKVVRIDEVRVGGETRSITVQPKGRMPKYNIQPVSGQRSWKLLDF